MSNELQRIENFVIYQTESGKVNVEVYFLDDTLWLTQKVMAQLFNKGRSTITGHLKKIFQEGELDGKVVCRDFRHTTKHGAIEGKVSALEAKLKAEGEYDKYRVEQDRNYISDFDKLIENTKNKKEND